MRMNNTTLSNILDTWSGVLSTGTGTVNTMDSITTPVTTWTSTSPVIATADWSSITVDPDLERKIEELRKENNHLKKTVCELEDKLHQLEGIMRTIVDEMENE